MSSFITYFLVFALVVSGIESDISCKFSRSTKKVKCDHQECSAVTDGTPIGYYKLGAVEFNHGKNKNRVKLYPRKKTRKDYWDYYCENPDTGRSKIALHPGSRSMGCISVPDANCWSRLEKLLKSQRSSIISVTGVKLACLRTWKSFSCNEDWLAAEQIINTVSVIGSLQVTR